MAVRWEQRHHDGDRRSLKIIGVLFEAKQSGPVHLRRLLHRVVGRRIGHRLVSYQLARLLAGAILGNHPHSETDQQRKHW